MPAYAKLIERYGEPHRAYHNLRHIRQCLAEFAPARRMAGEQDAVEMAIWYHDAIYDSHAKDNEERSAALAEVAGKAAGMPSGFLSRVSVLILATRHVATPEDADAALLVDIDLSILGQPPSRFDEYEKEIRQEYDWVEAKAFAAGRSTILKSFLERPSIYSTDFFRAKYEAKARENLARSVRRLEE
jgi:predicted metal-dependent HD superfamily phosphohydrolase